MGPQVEQLKSKVTDLSILNVEQLTRFLVKIFCVSFLCDKWVTLLYVEFCTTMFLSSHNFAFLHHYTKKLVYINPCNILKSVSNAFHLGSASFLPK